MRNVLPFLVISLACVSLVVYAAASRSGSAGGWHARAGRASAKKWRQSIKVREEKTSLGQWLKKQHPIQGARFGTAVIGRTVWILWPSNVSRCAPTRGAGIPTHIVHVDSQPPD